MYQPRLILASQSPRRKDILSLIQLPFETLAVDTEESLDPSLSIEENVTLIALRKAETAACMIEKTGQRAVILAADTVVAKGNRIYGKPADFDDAFGMLKTLQNRAHRVYTGFVLLSGDRSHTECVTTTVEFEPMSEREITRYLLSLQPYDKAGSYGIQDPLMACHIKRIEGCYYNVVGLPLSRVFKALKAFL
ncbi:septum formation protein Maf [Chlorobium sp. BLA1]|uniref:Maf family protein n=1 Tax=Candidatus Chlorobium masyuteum TaxID=2716876 RepID=UPI001421F117|nr:Maf family protein [Candidatus Chlorobium masyuteum]NHQ60335.1 septum formation protein Maf [Candidatus Chlorobium masyuteum]